MLVVGVCVCNVLIQFCGEGGFEMKIIRWKH